MKIYVTSSSRSNLQPVIIADLRDAGHEVHDPRNPGEGHAAFKWPATWPSWTPPQYAAALQTDDAAAAFVHELAALEQAHLCVLIHPSAAAPLAAGYAAGRRIPLVMFASSGFAAMPVVEGDVFQRLGVFCFSTEQVTDTAAKLRAMIVGRGHGWLTGEVLQWWDLQRSKQLKTGGIP